MANPSWLNALKEACYHAHNPALHYDTEEGIVFSMLWHWEDHSTSRASPWERPAGLRHRYENYSSEDVFALLQRAIMESNEHDRAFALILLGALATPKALDIVRSFLASPSLKERWASAIALGRHKEERVFPFLQTLLLDGFLVRRESAHEGEAEKGRAGSQDAYPPIDDLSVAIEYEWYVHQRWECALVLGSWDNPCVVPLLIEALQAAWRMEQAWPDYQGYTEGPEIWHAFQDRLAFALGELGAWHALRELDLPEKRLLIATIYLALGALRIQDTSIFYFAQASNLFSVPPTPRYLSRDTTWLAKFPLATQERARQAFERHDAFVREHFLARPYVEPVRVKQLLGRHLGFSETEQEQYLQCFPKLCPGGTKKAALPLSSNGAVSLARSVRFSIPTMYFRTPEVGQDGYRLQKPA